MLFICRIVGKTCSTIRFMQSVPVIRKNNLKNEEKYYGKTNPDQNQRQ